MRTTLTSAEAASSTTATTATTATPCRPAVHDCAAAADTDAEAVGVILGLCARIYQWYEC